MDKTNKETKTKKTTERKTRYMRNINDKLALGYGSKYQLLRMLGWHRNEFNRTIADTLGLNDSDINWLDFGYNGPCDSELLNLDFIPELKEQWGEYWVCGRGGIHWDAVGVTADGSYIFVEAKAHLCEFDSPAGGKPESVKRNNKRIREFLDKYGISSSEDKWSESFYQLANRLVVTDFVNSNGKKAYLVYVLFEHGYEYNSTKKDSASKEEWIEKMKEEIEMTGISVTDAEKLLNYCVIDCNRK